MAVRKNVFYAECRGTLLPNGEWTAVVLSVYSKAVNLLLPEGVLISLIRERSAMSDYGIVVPSLFERVVLKDYQNCAVRGNPECIVVGSLAEIDLRHTERWTGTVSICRTLSDFSLVLEAYNELAVSEGFSSIITGRTEDIYSKAASGILGRITVERGVPVDLSPLIGLGIGFTPSGDDFIAGVFLYERLSGINYINKESIRNHLSGTTAGGRTLLAMVLSSSFPHYLRQFGEALCTRNIPAREAVVQAVRHGSTSGSDALAGFLWIAGFF